MARPRIFVSSTYYDLKHLRSSLEVFIESMGYEAVLFEKGDIAFDPDSSLDVSCYREAQSADIFVLIIGGRYGAMASDESKALTRSFFDEYNSITKTEFDTAQKAGAPTFILIDSSVHSEYDTYRNNIGNNSIKYAHVDSVNIFSLIDTIYSKSKNNVVYKFERATDITVWLREQWSGLFKELLQSRSQNRQLGALSDRVSELKTVNETLKSYLEEVLRVVEPQKSQSIIDDQTKKLDVSRLANLIKNGEGSDLYEALVMAGIPYDEVVRAVAEPINANQVFDAFDKMISDPQINSVNWPLHRKYGREDYNKMRKSISRPEIKFNVRSKDFRNRRAKDFEKNSVRLAANNIDYLSDTE